MSRPLDYIRGLLGGRARAASAAGAAQAAERAEARWERVLEEGRRRQARARKEAMDEAARLVESQMRRNADMRETLLARRPPIPREEGDETKPED